MTFTDPYSYAADLRNGQYEVFGSSSRTFAAKTVRFDLSPLWLKREQIDVPWIMRLAGGRVERAAIAFFGDTGSAPLQVNGVSATANDIWIVGPGTTHYASDGPSSIMTMSLPFEDVAAMAANMTGRAFSAPDKSYVMRQTPATMGRLRVLHAPVSAVYDRASAIFSRA